jgi:hypothetical protein
MSTTICGEIQLGNGHWSPTLCGPPGADRAGIIRELAAKHPDLPRRLRVYRDEDMQPVGTECAACCTKGCEGCDGKACHCHGECTDCAARGWRAGLAALKELAREPGEVGRWARQTQGRLERIVAFGRRVEVGRRLAALKAPPGYGRYGQPPKEPEKPNEMDRLQEQVRDPNSRLNQDAARERQEAARARPKPDRREEPEEQERRVEQEVERLDPAEVLARLTFTLAQFIQVLLARASARG